MLPWEREVYVSLLVNYLKEEKSVENKNKRKNGGRNKRCKSRETKKVNLELEIDTNTVDSSKNRYQGLIDLAKAIDSWRIFPRIFITTYIFYYTKL